MHEALSQGLENRRYCHPTEALLALLMKTYGINNSHLEDLLPERC